MIGLASSDFARHYSRNHCCFLFLWVLRCFTSPRSLYPPYIFRRESPGRIAPPGGVSPFGNPRIKACLSAPRGLSQITTSFFGSRCQGIHRLLLETCNHMSLNRFFVSEKLTNESELVRSIDSPTHAGKPVITLSQCDLNTYVLKSKMLASTV